MRSDFVERNEDEGALGEARVGDLETGLGDDEIAVEKDVEVEGARAIGNGGGAIAAEFALDGEEGGEEIAGSKRGFEGEGGVEEERLIGEADGGGGVERRLRGDAADCGEARGSRGERGFRGAGGAGEIGSEGDGREGHADKRVAEPAELAELG